MLVHPMVLVPQDLDLGCEAGHVGHACQGQSKWFTWIQKGRDAI